MTAEKVCLMSAEVEGINGLKFEGLVQLQGNSKDMPRQEKNKQRKKRVEGNEEKRRGRKESNKGDVKEALFTPKDRSKIIRDD